MTLSFALESWAGQAAVDGYCKFWDNTFYQKQLAISLLYKDAHYVTTHTSHKPASEYRQPKKGLRKIKIIVINSITNGGVLYAHL